jgi:hypothetical protein
MQQKEGWYTGTVVSECSVCGEFPVRIGPRCNVIKVETEIAGPDSACIVTCDDDACSTAICPPKSANTQEVYRPAYAVTFHDHEGEEKIGLIGGRKPTLLNGKTEDGTCTT